MTLVASVLVLIGSIFSVCASLGLLRFPHLYARLHAAALVGPLGAGLIILGLGIASGSPSVAIRCLLGLALLLLVNPVSAHLLARAAFPSAPKGGSTPSIDPPR
jgi:multicomponent Na+:H+ antiporter subunit G